MPRPTPHCWKCRKWDCAEMRLYVKNRFDQFATVGWIGSKCGEVTLDKNVRHELSEEEKMILATLRLAVQRKGKIRERAKLVLPPLA
jgi:hypothetical protein